MQPVLLTEFAKTMGTVQKNYYPNIPLEIFTFKPYSAHYPTNPNLKGKFDEQRIDCTHQRCRF